MPLRVSRSWASAIAAADLGDAGHDGRERREMGADRLGEDASEGRLAGARRAPQQQRREVAARHRTPQGSLLTDEVALAHELLERSAVACVPPAAGARAAVGTAPPAGHRQPWDGWSAWDESRGGPFPAADRESCSDEPQISGAV